MIRNQIYSFSTEQKKLGRSLIKSFLEIKITTIFGIILILMIFPSNAKSEVNMENLSNFLANAMSGGNRTEPQTDASGMPIPRNNQQLQMWLRAKQMQDTNSYRQQQMQFQQDKFARQYGLDQKEYGLEQQRFGLEQNEDLRDQSKYDEQMQVYNSLKDLTLREFTSEDDEIRQKEVLINALKSSPSHLPFKKLDTKIIKDADGNEILMKFNTDGTVTVYDPKTNRFNIVENNPQALRLRQQQNADGFDNPLGIPTGDQPVPQSNIFNGPIDLGNRNSSITTQTQQPATPSPQFAQAPTQQQSVDPQIDTNMLTETLMEEVQAIIPNATTERVMQEFQKDPLGFLRMLEEAKMQNPQFREINE